VVGAEAFVAFDAFHHWFLEVVYMSRGFKNFSGGDDAGFHFHDACLFDEEFAEFVFDVLF
jgi:hypothetical protein